MSLNQAQAQASDVAEALWQSLALKEDGVLSTDKDLAGLLDTQGLEVRVESWTPISVVVTDEPLQEDNLDAWLQQDTIDSDLGSDQSTLQLKLLCGTQVSHRDGLRPPPDAVATRFSRRSVCRHFGLPEVALERISSNDPWMIEFAIDRSGIHTCLGMGTADIGVVWTQQANPHYMDTIRAIVIFMSKNSGARSQFIADLNSLRDLCHVTGFFPFLILKASLACSEKRMAHFRQTIGTTDVRLGRFPDGKEAAAVYGAAISMSRSLAGTLRELKTMSRMAKKIAETQTVPTCSLDQQRDLKEGELRKVFRYLEQRVQAMIEDAEEDLKHTSRQLDSALSIMAQAQQELSIAQQELSIEIARGQARLAEDTRKDQTISIEIAEASKRIAEDTKRDGTSMKTLAVVTLVYLPATAVSSILAMPLFDWSAHGDAVVNPRIWVFFVLAVPLTVLTISVWYLWLRMRRSTLGLASHP
jgi:hypothetical protein